MKERKKSLSSPKISNTGEGYMPPQCIDMEEAVLGAVMLEKCLNEISDILTPESFYKESNQKIYSTCLNLFRNSNPVDILTVTQELKRTGELDSVGGAYYITKLTDRVASSANVEYHARLVQQTYIAREIIRTSTLNIQNAYDPTTDIFDLLDFAENNLYQITKSTFSKEPERASKLTKEVTDELERIIGRPDGLSGVPSGLTSLDRVTGGFTNGELIIIAARPSMGKSSLLNTFALNAGVRIHRPIAIFSLEVSKGQFMKNLVSGEAEVNNEKLKNPKTLDKDDWEKINQATSNINEAPIFIDDTPGLSIFELKAKARRLKEKHNIQLIIIDYLQLMTTGLEKEKGNREQEISFISRNLKSLAKDLNIPVIALSQLSRLVEGRGGEKKPMLSDLRESGAIEQDADVIIFPHRPEYYGIVEDAGGNSTKGLAELIIAKNRNGRVSKDEIYVRFQGMYTKFSDIETFETKFSSLPENNGFLTDKIYT